MEALEYLQDLQEEIDALSPDREAQYQKAKAQWEGRKNKKEHQAIWKEIEDKLKTSHPLPDICQYCEHDRNSPTEHFFPKKHFPGMTFKWDNYLKICHICNSECKADHFAVFLPAGSDIKFELPNEKIKYPAPPSEDAILINPRTENPQDFMMLDLGTGLFLPTPGANSRAKTKADYTVELLQLNKNAMLVRYRQKAFGNYLGKLREYSGVFAATDIASLLAAFPPEKQAIVVQTNPFPLEKSRLLNHIKNDLLDDPCPTVWLEIKSQREFFPDVDSLFQAVPEALVW